MSRLEKRTGDFRVEFCKPFVPRNRRPFFGGNILDSSGLVCPDAGAYTVDSSNVAVNSGGAFFTAVPDAEGHVTLTIPSTTADGPKTAITFLSQTSADAFILLHELGHQTGKFGPDAGPDLSTLNAANSWLVLDKCFGIKQPGGK